MFTSVNNTCFGHVIVIIVQQCTSAEQKLLSQVNVVVMQSGSSVSKSCLKA